MNPKTEYLNCHLLKFFFDKQSFFTRSEVYSYLKFYDIVPSRTTLNVHIETLVQQGYLSRSVDREARLHPFIYGLTQEGKEELLKRCL